MLEDVPQAVQAGIFKVPKKYDALIRFSPGGHEIKPDKAFGAAGMAIKLLGIEPVELAKAR